MASYPRTWGERALARLLGSEVRAKVIAWLCTQAEEPIIGRELARAVDANQMAVSKELRRLAELGMLRAGDRMGRIKPYYLNREFPLLPGLRAIVQYATGAVALLREKLADWDGINVAFIYGSVAAGDDRPESDVDLFVVGDMDGIVLSRVVGEVEALVGREIELVHWSPADLAAQMDEPSSFLSAVMRQPKVFVQGDEGELRRITGQ